MRKFTTTALVALACGAFAVPASASGGYHNDDGERAGFVERDDDEGRPSTRVKSRVYRAVKALDRASERIDDGETAGATSALKAVRTNLAGALKSTKRSLATVRGPANAALVARAQGRASTELIGLFDGQVDPTDAAVATTLRAVLDGRDDLLAAISGHDDEVQYGGFYGGVSSDTEDELADIAEALADDELTAAARSALEAAKTQITATKAAADARLEHEDEDEDEDDDTGYEDTGHEEDDDDDRGDCRDEDHGHH